METALLVDGDNVPPTVLGPVLARMQQDGDVTARRIYRNWRSSKAAQQWDEHARRLAFERVDRYRTTPGKNGSDIAVAVEAVDLFHEGYRSFCIVSGDTDFAPLIERLRRGGSRVVVVGHKAEAGLLAELADEYLTFTELTGDGEHPGRRGKKAAKAAPRPAARARTKEAPRHKPAKAPAAQAQDRGQKGGRQAKQANASPATAKKRQGPPLDPKVAGFLSDAYQVALTDGDVDEDGWVYVDRLGMALQSLGFDPAKHGVGARASLSRVVGRFADRFELRRHGSKYQMRPR